MEGYVEGHVEGFICREGTAAVSCGTVLACFAATSKNAMYLQLLFVIA